VRFAINLIKPMLDGFMARLAMDPINWYVAPATSDSADFDRAELGTDVLRYYQDVLGLRWIDEELTRWATLTGECFVKVVWDPYRGSEFGRFAASELGLTPEDFRRKYAELEELHTGDLCISPVPIFNVCWGPQGCEWDEKDWLLEEHDRSIAYVLERYKIKLDDIEPEAGETANRYYLSQVDRPKGETVRVRTLWVRRVRGVKGLEQGRHVCVVGRNKVVVNEPNPYQHGEIPFVRNFLLRVPGEPRGETFATDLLAPQLRLNVTVSQLIENQELMANPRIYVQRGSMQNLHEMYGRPGGIFEYDGSLPTHVPGLEMGRGAYLAIDQTIKFMQDIVRLHDVSQAKNPPQVRAARSIERLQERDDMHLAFYAARRRDLWARVGQMALQTLAQYATEERWIKILGQEDVWRTRRFTGDMLTGLQSGPGVNYFDVRVRTSGLPMSRMSRIEMLMALIERGALQPATNPQDRELMIETMELGYARRSFDPTRQDREIQRRRNELMAQGGYEPPRDFEDPDTLQDELNRFRKSPAFESIDAVRQRAFEQYQQEVIKMVAARQLKKQALVEQGAAEARAELRQVTPLAQQTLAPPLPANPGLPGLNGNGRFS